MSGRHILVFVTTLTCDLLHTVNLISVPMFLFQRFVINAVLGKKQSCLRINTFFFQFTIVTTRAHSLRVR